MLFQSTRQTQQAATTGFSQALLKGLAPDGGLYVPQQWPVHQPAQLCARIGLPPQQYLTAAGLARIGALLLEPLVADSELASQLPAITAQAFSFPAPLVALAGRRIAWGSWNSFTGRRRPSRISARAFSRPAWRACAHPGSVR